MAGIVEELILLRNNPSAGNYTVLFRNDQQMVELKSAGGVTVQGQISPADLSIPTFAKWGNINNHFFIGGGLNSGGVRVVHVFRLNREANAGLGATTATATFVSSITLPSIVVAGFGTITQAVTQTTSFLNKDLTLSVIRDGGFNIDFNWNTFVFTAGVLAWSSTRLAQLVGTGANAEKIVSPLGGYWEQSDLAGSYVFLSWGVTNTNDLTQWANGICWETGTNVLTLGPSSFDAPFGGPGDGIHTFQTVVASSSREWTLYLLGTAASGVIQTPPTSLIAYMRKMSTGVITVVSAEYGAQPAVFNPPHLHAGLYHFLTGGNWFYATDNRAAFMGRGIGLAAVNEVSASPVIFTKTSVSDPTDTAQLLAAERGHLIQYLAAGLPNVQLVLGVALQLMTDPASDLFPIPTGFQASMDTLNASSDTPPHYQTATNPAPSSRGIPTAQLLEACSAFSVCPCPSTCE